MPKAAIQISGEFRCLHLTKDSFEKNILQDLQKKGYAVDVFVHCWKRDETSLGTYPFEGRGDWHKTMAVFSNADGVNLFKPTSYLFQEPDEVSVLKDKNRFVHMYYSIFMANHLRKIYEMKTGSKYDLVIRYRTDCIVNEPLLKHLPAEASFLVIPRSTKTTNCDGPWNDGDDKHVCDWLAYGTPDCMNIYCDTFVTWVSENQTPEGEACLAQHLSRKNQKIIRSDLSFFIIEGNGQIRGNLRNSTI